MSQLTLRKIPALIDKELRQLSARKTQSLNTTILETLQKGLGLDGNVRKKRDLSRYAGTWSQEEFEQFEKSCMVFEQIDPEVWKS